MVLATPILAFSLSSLSTGTWIDIVSLALILVFTICDAIRGFSSTLSLLLGLLIAIHAGYWLYQPLNLFLGDLAFSKSHPTAGALLPYAAAIVIGILLFLLFRYFFRHFFKLIVESPMDQILGGVAGAVKALLILLIIFSGASLLPAKSPVNRAFRIESKMGRRVIPVVQTVLTRGKTLLPGQSDD